MVFFAPLHLELEDDTDAERGKWDLTVNIRFKKKKYTTDTLDDCV